MQVKIIGRFAYIHEHADRSGYSMSVLLHADRTSDADSLRRSAAEARAKAARELKKAERMERAAEQLTKGE